MPYISNLSKVSNLKKSIKAQRIHKVHQGFVYFVKIFVYSVVKKRNFDKQFNGLFRLLSGITIFMEP